MAGRAKHFMVAEKISTSECTLGKKNDLLARFFILGVDRFLDEKNWKLCWILRIGSFIKKMFRQCNVTIASARIST